MSSGVIRNADPAMLDHDLLAGSGASSFTLYAETKFAQLLGAHWWRRELATSCKVVAVSPGLIPGTGLGKGSGTEIPKDLPDAKSVFEGELSIPLHPAVIAADHEHQVLLTFSVLLRRTISPRTQSRYS